ncbi:hypothetical protein [Sphingomonas hankookensis]|uniref:hypothetical protein n=1 Tax=Sphingomonas hankookensis TaxID=563996 RepID=UPI003D301815
MTPTRGRPLRFLALVTLGWVGMRVTLLWPEDVPRDQWVKGVLPIPRTVSVIASPGRVPAVSERRFAASLPPAPMPTAMTPARVILPPVVAPIDPAAPLSEARIQLALLALTGFSAAEPLSRPAAPPPHSPGRLATTG